MSELLNRTYSDLRQLSTYDDRFDYLKVTAPVAQETFGFERWMNQKFYTSKEWRRIRDEVIVRDQGCDLGLVDYPIRGKVMVHHMLPLTPDMLEQSDDTILNPEYLITCSLITHNGIHFGKNPMKDFMIERSPNDTCPWRR